MHSLDDVARAIGGHRWLGLAALGCLLCVFVPDQAIKLHDSQGQRLVSDIVGQMASWYLLPALGLVLAMRRGVIDFSVWVTMSLGALLATIMLDHGWPHPVVVLAIVIAVGAIVGGINAVLAAVLRFRGTLVTLATAIALWALIRWGFGPLAHDRQIAVGDEPMQALIFPGFTLFVSRIILVVIAYAAVVFVLRFAIAPSSHGTVIAQQVGPLPKLAISLVVGGALSAAGGFAWLMSNAAAPVPKYPIGDLRVIVAALLAGALLLRGPGKTLVATLLLPPALLVATLWYQNVWYLQWGAVQIDLALLLVLVAVVQLAGLKLSRSPSPAALGAWVLAVAGLALLAGSGLPESHRPHIVLRYAGLALAAGGTILTAALWVLRPRDKKTHRAVEQV